MAGSVPLTGPGPVRLALAAALRELRARTGRSLKDLEKVTAISDSALSRYLTGATLPPWSAVQALSTAAGQDPARLRTLWEHCPRERYGAGASQTLPAARPNAQRRRAVQLGLVVAGLVAVSFGALARRVELGGGGLRVTRLD